MRFRKPFHIKNVSHSTIQLCSSYKFISAKFETSFLQNTESLEMFQVSSKLDYWNGSFHSYPRSSPDLKTQLLDLLSKQKNDSIHCTCITPILIPGTPLTYFNDGGVGGSKWFFGVWNFGRKWFFGVYERCQDFLGSQKKTKGLFWVAKKGLREFFGYAKKRSDLFGYRTSVRPPPLPCQQNMWVGSMGFS